MIFSYRLYDAIVVDRTKTVTRRPAFDKRGRATRPPVEGAVLPLQRGYRKATAHARVISVRREPAFMPDWQDNEEARREGFRNGEQFWLVWRDIYGEEPIDVWRIEFALLIDS